MSDSDQLTIAGVKYVRSDSDKINANPSKTAEKIVVSARPATFVPRPMKHQTGSFLAALPREVRGTALRQMFTGSGNGPATVKVSLPLLPGDVDSNGAGAVIVNYGVQYNQIAGITDWTTVFKEYRITAASLEFMPSAQATLVAGDNTFAAGINYSTNNSSPGSYIECLTLDQGKIVGFGLNKPTKWHCDFTKIFGDVWTDTGTNVIYATWKAYGMGAATFSVHLGYFCGRVDVEFRGFA